MSKTVTVSLDLTEHGYLINVRVKSRTKSHLFGKVTIDPTECTNADEVLKRVELGAIHSARHLESHHGDHYNLTELVQDARSEFISCMHQAATHPKDTSDLITKLLKDTSLLTNEHLEITKRAKLLADRSMPVPSKLSDALQTIWNTVYGTKTAPFSANRA